MAENYLSSQLDREKHCANRSRDTMFKWFAGGAVVFGGGTYLAHLYCQPLQPLLERAIDMTTSTSH